MVGGRERCGKVLVVPSQCGPLLSFLYSNHVVLRGRATTGPPRQQNKKQPHPPQIQQTPTTPALQF